MNEAPNGDGSAVALIIQVLQDGVAVEERRVTLREINDSAGAWPTFSADFDVVARRVPAPLNQLTPVTDLTITSTGVAHLRILSAVVTRIGDPR